MNTNQEPSFIHRYLDPSERLGEILFGLIMVLTFTLTAGLTIDQEDPGAARELFIAALGCNIAWGIIDGGFYIMGAMMARARKAKALRDVQTAANEPAALSIIAEAMQGTLADHATPEERGPLFQAILKLARRAPPEQIRATRDDMMGAIAVCFLVIVSCIPASIPFLFIEKESLAMRTSNAILLLMLFLIGYQWGRHAFTSKWISGLVFLVIGLALVLIAIALGG